MRRDFWVAYNRLRGYASIETVRLPIRRPIVSRSREKSLALGRYEPSLTSAVKESLRDNDVVLELGAGLGYISSYLRRQTGVGRIVCYEANPDLIPYIRDVHGLNKVQGVEVRHGVVTPAPPGTTLPFYIRSSTAASSLNETDGPVARIVDVPVIAWRTVVDEVQPTAAIMDIEGAELDVLEADDFGPVRRLVLETHPIVYGTAGLKRLYDALTRHGFQYKSLYHVSVSTAPVITFER
jgi:FkbM family methyltransferase